MKGLNYLQQELSKIFLRNNSKIHLPWGKKYGYKEIFILHFKDFDLDIYFDVSNG